MGLLLYTHSGISVNVALLKTNRIVRRVVESGSGRTYHATEWTFDVFGEVNPGGISFVEGPLARPGTRPSLTDFSIRTFLMAKRGRLTWVNDDGLPYLDTPVPPLDCDVAGGPDPVECNVSQVKGSEGFQLHWVVKATVNECRSPSVLLSNEWTQWVEVDEHKFATRHTAGEAVFRLDLLRQLRAVPDLFREVLFHPVPTRFRRSLPHVEQSADGATLRYHLVDRQLSHAVTPDAEEIELYDTVWGRLKGFSIGGALEQFGHSFGGIGSILQGNTSDFLAGVASLLAAPIQAMPTFHRHIFCRVWGRPDSKNIDLENVAFAAVLGLTGFSDLVTLPTIEATLTWDRLGRFVEFQVSFLDEPGFFTAGKMIAVATKGGAFPRSEVITYKGVPVASNDAGSPGAGPQARGDWLGLLVSQFLQAPCAPPFVPVNWELPKKPTPSQQPSGDYGDGSVPDSPYMSNAQQGQASIATPDNPGSQNP
jgi:hypothetical protein